MTQDAEIQSLSIHGHDAEVIEGDGVLYDVLKDEFPSGAGMDENEHNGTMDTFQVISKEGTAYHSNLPAFRRYYVFVFNKVG